MSSREIAYSIAYALTDRRPEGWLLTDAEKGKLDTKEGVVKEIKKMLNSEKTRKPRILRFFREYFGYVEANEVFKERKRYPDHDARILIEDTDRLIEYILEKDKDVLAELLTTNKSFVAHRIAEDIKKKREKERIKFEQQKKKNPAKYRGKKPRRIGKSIYEAYNLKDFPDQQPVELPKDQRAGILTQPSWLVSFSKSDENHAILRGKWVRERLLGGVVPDIPITVDAQLPNAPHQTLRARMSVTQENYCWQCHRLMNPVGLPFEQFDHIGRYREAEEVLDPEETKKNVDRKGKSKGPIMRGVPVDAKGAITLLGRGKPEAEVKNAVEMLRILAKSEYVEQVFVRHAFRYWMGRNETLGDARSLQEAHQAYRKSGGSMKALITALLTSDSFLYRVQGGQ